MSTLTRKLCALLITMVALLSASMFALCDQTQQLIAQCDSCHLAPEQASPIAPSLHGISEDYLFEQMANFQQGKRGQQLNDAAIIPAHDIDQDSISLVADFYEELEARHSADYSAFKIEGLSASETDGQALYDDQCSVCHGSWFGRWISDSPAIQHLPPQYIADQIKAFANNERSFVTPGGYKNDMLEVAKELSDQELLDIIQYININAESL